MVYVLGPSILTYEGAVNILICQWISLESSFVGYAFTAKAPITGSCFVMHSVAALLPCTLLLQLNLNKDFIKTVFFMSLLGQIQLYATAPLTLSLTATARTAGRFPLLTVTPEQDYTEHLNLVT